MNGPFGTCRRQRQPPRRRARRAFHNRASASVSSRRSARARSRGVVSLIVRKVAMTPEGGSWLDRLASGSACVAPLPTLSHSSLRSGGEEGPLLALGAALCAFQSGWLAAAGIVILILVSAFASGAFLDSCSGSHGSCHEKARHRSQRHRSRGEPRRPTPQPKAAVAPPKGPADRCSSRTPTWSGSLTG